jgi:hypothetical protein
MIDSSRKAKLTAELLVLTQQQQKALEDATYLGWREGQVEAYQDRGDRISLLRQQLNLVIAAEKLEVLRGALPVAPDLDAKPS